MYVRFLFPVHVFTFRTVRDCYDEYERKTGIKENACHFCDNRARTIFGRSLRGLGAQKQDVIQSFAVCLYLRTLETYFVHR